MPASRRAARQGPRIPPDTRRSAPLFLVVAILVFLAALAALAASSAWRATDQWTAALAASATVQILPVEGEDPDETAARAAAILSALPEVTEARALPAAEAEALLAPWFGASLPDDLPAPRLIAVTLADAQDDGETPRTAPLAQTLADADLAAEVDDHDRWESEVTRAAAAAQALGLAAVALLMLAACAVSVFAVRAGMAARRDVVETLRVAGASDRLIAFLFLRRFFLMGLASGAAGAVLAAMAGGGIYAALPQTDGLIALPAPGLREAAILLTAPAAAALIGAATAWLTSIAELGRAAQ